MSLFQSWVVWDVKGVWSHGTDPGPSPTCWLLPSSGIGRVQGIKWAFLEGRVVFFSLFEFFLILFTNPILHAVKIPYILFFWWWWWGG